MSEYFEKLTKENWGLPWHVLLALLAVNAGSVALALLLPLLQSALIVFVAVQVVGYVYEIRQIKKGPGMWLSDNSQDVFGNLLGGLAGAVLFFASHFFRWSSFGF